MGKEVACRVSKELEMKNKELDLAKEKAAKQVEECQKHAADAIEKKFAIEENKTKQAMDACMAAKNSNGSESAGIQAIQEEIRLLKNSVTQNQTAKQGGTTAKLMEEIRGMREQVESSEKRIKDQKLANEKKDAEDKAKREADEAKADHEKCKKDAEPKMMKQRSASCGCAAKPEPVVLQIPSTPDCGCS